MDKENRYFIYFFLLIIPFPFLAALNLKSLENVSLIMRDFILCCYHLIFKGYCSTIFLPSILPLAVLSLFGFGLVKALGRFFLNVCRDISLFKSLCPLIQKTPSNIVHFIEDLGLAEKTHVFQSTLGTAFVLGFLRPKIFLSSQILKELKEEELKGVLLHEKYHLVKKEPLKRLVLFFLKDMLFFLPISNYLYQSFLELSEERADHAAARGHNPLDLASALVKMLRLNRNVLIDTSTFHGIPTFALFPHGRKCKSGDGISSPEKRILRLLGAKEFPSKRPVKLFLTTFFMILLFMCSGVFPASSDYKYCEHSSSLIKGQCSRC